MDDCQACERAFQQLEIYGVPRQRARHVANGIGVLATRMDRENAALRAEIAGLRRDAERYRWIRKGDEHGPRTLQMMYHHDIHLDAYIDAAIQRTAPTERPNSLKEEGGSPNPAPTEAQT